MVSISKSGWDSLSEEDQAAFIAMLRRRNLLGETESISLDPSLEPLSFGEGDISDLAGGGTKKRCQKRCNKFAEFMYYRCLEEGGTHKDCEDAAKLDFAECMEECMNEE